MAYAYPDYFRMSPSQARLMDVWDKSYPVQKWNVKGLKKIQALQGNEKPVCFNSLQALKRKLS